MGPTTILAFISESAAGGAGKRAAEFDQELALLHNSLIRALLERFPRVAKERSQMRHGLLVRGDQL
jgi:hypothetical protein